MHETNVNYFDSSHRRGFTVISGGPHSESSGETQQHCRMAQHFCLPSPHCKPRGALFRITILQILSLVDTSCKSTTNKSSFSHIAQPIIYEQLVLRYDWNGLLTGLNYPILYSLPLSPLERHPSPLQPITIPGVSLPEKRPRLRCYLGASDPRDYTGPVRAQRLLLWMQQLVGVHFMRHVDCHLFFMI